MARPCRRTALLLLTASREASPAQYASGRPTHALPSPPYLQPAGDRAWETVFGAFAPVLQGEPLVDATLHSVVLQIPLEGEPPAARSRALHPGLHAKSDQQHHADAQPPALSPRSGAASPCSRRIAGAARRREVRTAPHRSRPARVDQGGVRGVLSASALAAEPVLAHAWPWGRAAGSAGVRGVGAAALGPALLPASCAASCAAVLCQSPVAPPPASPAGRTTTATSSSTSPRPSSCLSAGAARCRWAGGGQHGGPGRRHAALTGAACRPAQRGARDAEAAPRRTLRAPRASAPRLSSQPCSARSTCCLLPFPLLRTGRGHCAGARGRPPGRPGEGGCGSQGQGRPRRHQGAGRGGQGVGKPARVGRVGRLRGRGVAGGNLGLPACLPHGACTLACLPPPPVQLPAPRVTSVRLTFLAARHPCRRRRRCRRWCCPLMTRSLTSLSRHGGCPGGDVWPAAIPSSRALTCRACMCLATLLAAHGGKSPIGESPRDESTQN